MMNWITTPLGAKLHKNLPVTIDSLRSKEFNNTVELYKDHWYIDKGLNKIYNSFFKKLYHAWLILTNKAFAVQFTEDHIKCYERYNESKSCK